MPRPMFVFLNACQVGAGQRVLGDYAGLATAFLSAGAAGVVAALWNVHDLAARERERAPRMAWIRSSGAPVVSAVAGSSSKARRPRLTVVS